VLTPVFSGNKEELFYLRYFRGKSQIFSINSQSLLSKRVGGFRVTTFSPCPHPKDRNLLLISAIFEGNTDVYELNIGENSAKRLTKSPAIDTTACYSPDGKMIAFSSDRENGQQIYSMDVNGNFVKRISSGAGSYSKPVWSPDGKLIAFTKIKSNVFYIGIMNADGSNEKLLISAYLVEGAKWSPNGRYLIYSKKKGFWSKDGVPRLYIVDIVTGFEYEIPTPEGEGATDPDWK
jgi:TolB protein